MWTRKLIAIYLFHLDWFLAILLLYTCLPLPMNLSLLFLAAISSFDVGNLAAEQQVIWMNGIAILHVTLSIAFALTVIVQAMAGILFLIFYPERQTALTIKISVAWYWASMVYLCSMAANLTCSEVDPATGLFICMLIQLRLLITNALFNLRDVWNS